MKNIGSAYFSKASVLFDAVYQTTVVQNIYETITA